MKTDSRSSVLWAIPFSAYLYLKGSKAKPKCIDKQCENGFGIGFGMKAVLNSGSNFAFFYSWQKSEAVFNRIRHKEFETDTVNATNKMLFV